jgi:signal peptidase I
MTQVSLPDLTIPNAVLLELMQAALSQNATFHFRTLGWSMAPFIRPGDVVIVAPLKSHEPATGQVVTFIHMESSLLLVHRMLQGRDSTCLIQGDNMSG